MRFAEKRAERPLVSPSRRRRDQAKQNTQGYPRSQVGGMALLQQSLREHTIVVSIFVWAQQQAIRKRCEQFLGKGFVVRLRGVGNSGRSSLLVSKQRQVNKLLQGVAVHHHPGVGNHGRVYRSVNKGR